MSSEEELQKACQTVERHLRSIGKDCEVIFTDDGVHIAPLAWSGDVVEETLFEALQEAKKVIQ